MRTKWIQSLVNGSDVTLVEGVCGTESNLANHPEGSFAGNTTVILGAASPPEMEILFKTKAEWKITLPSDHIEDWAQGFIVVGCVRMFGGCHSEYKNQRVQIYINDKEIEWFDLRDVPPPHADYFHRPILPPHETLEEISICQTVYLWPIDKHKLVVACPQTVRLEIDKYVQWDIDHIGILAKVCVKPAYDVALSFAGEDREYVEKVAAHLIKRGVNVFYDDYERVDLWGKNLYTHLVEVYRDKALHTVMFLSHHYAKKLWTNHEREAAQTCALETSSEYILPVRFDNTDIPGILSTTAYIDLTDLKPETLSNIIIEKVDIIKKEQYRYWKQIDTD